MLSGIVVVVTVLTVTDMSLGSETIKEQSKLHAVLSDVITYREKLMELLLVHLADALTDQRQK